MKKRSFSFLLFALLLYHYNGGAQTRAFNAFGYASEIVVDSKGNLFVAGRNNKIIKITPDRVSYLFAGSPRGYTQNKDGKGDQAMFNGIRGLAIDASDNIYVADYNTIRKVTPDGVVTSFAGSISRTTKDGNRNMAGFKSVGSIAIDRNGILYVTDEIFDQQQNATFNIIRKISPSGDVSTIKNEDGSLFRCHSISGLACDTYGNLYVSAVAWSSSIKKITPDGTISTVAGVYNENARSRAFFKEGDLQSASIVDPHGIAIGPTGEIYFSDPWIHRILKIANNQLTIVAGGGGKSADGANYLSGSGSGGSADGKGRQALFENPDGVAFDQQGNLFIVDVSTNSRIRKLSPDGIVTTYLKQSYNPATQQYEDDNNPVATVKPAKNAEAETPVTPLKKQLDSILNDPRIKKVIKGAQALNVDSLKRAVDKIAHSTTPDPRENDTSSYSIPRKNIKALSNIPQKVLSPSELQSYAATLYKKLAPAFHTAYGTLLVNTDSYDANTISNSSAVAEATGHLDQAVLLSLKAVEKNPGDPAALNNAGVIMKKGGLEIAAVTMLEAANKKDSNNSTIQNNLGQAWLGLGEKEKAERYLQTAVTNSPYHPLANSSLALINYAKGNKEAALRYTENSLRGAFTDRAWHLLYKLKKDAVLMDYFRHRYKQPEYFNEDKYHLPMQCEKVSDIPAKKGEYDAYREMLTKVKANFDALAKAEMKSGQEAMMQKAKQGKIYQPPFMELASAMMLDIKLQMDRNGWDQIARAQKKYHDQISTLQNEYKNKRNHIEGCGAHIALANEYMEKMSVVTREYQKTYLRIYKDFYHDMAYWSFFSNSEPHLRKGNFCSLASSLLGVLLQLAETHFLDDISIDCASVEEKKETAEEIEIEGHCPIAEDGFEIPFGIGKFNFSCEKWELQLGEALVLNLSHKFTSGETIWALGPGVSLSLVGSGHESRISVPQLKAGPIKPGLEAGIKGQVYLTFRNGELMDWGGLFTTELDLLGIAKEFRTGYTIGMNSGLELEEGPLKNVIDKAFGPDGEAPQINKNVKPYKPQGGSN